MGRRKTVLLAMVFSLFSLTMAYGAEGKAAEPEYVKVVVEADAPEKLHGEYIPVLMYHHFAERDMGSGNGTVVSTEDFEEHLRYLKADGYQFITLEKLHELLEKAEQMHGRTEGGLGLQGKYICISMDDGYFSNYDLAYPLLAKYNAAASVFAVTDFITDQYGLKKFTWEQAREMDGAGRLKVYSHTADHVPAANCTAEDFLASMQRSDAALTENLTGEHVKAMAYPNGSRTAETGRLLTEEGYVLQFTIEKGVITGSTTRDAIPRITVKSGMNGEDLVREIEMAAAKAFAAEREGN